jgi:hypothetical protein
VHRRQEHNLLRVTDLRVAFCHSICCVPSILPLTSMKNFRIDRMQAINSYIECLRGLIEACTRSFIHSFIYSSDSVSGCLEVDTRLISHRMCHALKLEDCAAEQKGGQRRALLTDADGGNPGDYHFISRCGPMRAHA